MNENNNPVTFTHRLKEASARVLMLDYDGTLAPFVKNRNEAFPYPGVREMLERIRSDSRNRIVIVSGRAVEDIAPLLDMDPLPEIWGSHGYEHRLENGEYIRQPVPDISNAALEKALGKIAISVVSEQLEIKPFSIAVHWRGLSDAEAGRIEETARMLWAPAVEAKALEIHEFSGGLELRIPGRTKGDAVRDVLEAYGPDAVYAYFGDDDTDEDAFEALGQYGLSVLVRKEMRNTHADIRITPPEELLEWLEAWVG